MNEPEGKKTTIRCYLLDGMVKNKLTQSSTRILELKLTRQKGKMPKDNARRSGNSW
jgi:hypothetical protein